MKKRMILLLCLSAFLQIGWAQNTMESIRQRYSDIKDYIATHTGDNKNDGAEWGEYYHVVARQFLPGTGGHQEDVYMYFDEREEEKIYPSHYLTFATSRYNYSAREYYEEYLYDKDGKVAFVYVHDPSTSFDEGTDDKEYEMRFYLNKGKLIMSIIKNRDFGQGEYKDVFSGANLERKYAPTYTLYLEKAEKIRQMFISIEKEAYDYTD